MANTLTNLIPTIYQAADTVAREQTGFIPAVYRNSSAERAAKGETILYPVVGAMAAADIAAAATGPDPADKTIGNGTMSISKSRSVTFHWTGEEQKGLSNAGFYNQILQDQFAQAMRALCNEVEADLAALYVNASRAYGTAGTAPFGTAGDYTDAANMLKILRDNGAPLADLQLIVNTAAGVNLRGKQSQAHMQGSDSILRQGVLLDINGFQIRESAQVQSHTKGTGTSYAVNKVGGYAVGATSIDLDTGSGTMIAGDIINFADDSPDYNYVVKTALAGGTVIIQNPGLMATIANDKAVTIGGNYAANLAFHRSAIHLITRAPAMPEGGDSADDVIEVMDPRSGLAFQVAMYRQRRRVSYEVGLAWGVAAPKPEFMGILIG